MNTLQQTIDSINNIQKTANLLFQQGTDSADRLGYAILDEDRGVLLDSLQDRLHNSGLALHNIYQDDDGLLSIIRHDDKPSFK